MTTARGPSPGVYAGLFLVTLATITYEIALTRIFSITMWYHFAFVAISVAMFGMTVGALIVYCGPPGSRWSGWRAASGPARCCSASRSCSAC